MSLQDYSFREAGREDFFRIEDLFEGRVKGRDWASWKYLKNPDGPARVFIAEALDQTLIGTLAYMPRRFLTPDRGVLTVMQAVDIFLAAEFRSAGVFLKLYDFARSRISGPRIGVPNENSRVFGMGAGWQVLGPYQDWKFPVMLGARHANKTVGLGTSIANGFCRLYAACWLAGAKGDLRMTSVSRFRQEYPLDSAAIHGVRSADYLNWRFLDNPETKYQAYEFFDGEQSIGYCVFARVNSVAILSDLVTSRSHRRCLRLLVDHCRSQGITKLSFHGAGLPLAKLGFVRRKCDKDLIACDVPEGHWLVTPCDTDGEPGPDIAAHTPEARGQGGAYAQ